MGGGRLFIGLGFGSPIFSFHDFQTLVEAVCEDVFFGSGAFYRELGAQIGPSR